MTGQLPAWLAGSLLVNGGGDYQRMQHMFDGYACVTKVKVADGKAWGAQRYLQTQAYQSYKQAGEVQLLQWCCCSTRVCWCGLHGVLAVRHRVMTKLIHTANTYSHGAATCITAAAEASRLGHGPAITS